MLIQGNEEGIVLETLGMSQDIQRHDGSRRGCRREAVEMVQVIRAYCDIGGDKNNIIKAQKEGVVGR